MFDYALMFAHVNVSIRVYHNIHTNQKQNEIHFEISEFVFQDVKSLIFIHTCFSKENKRKKSILPNKKKSKTIP